MLTVVQIAHPSDALPPSGYGGIGRVVHGVHRYLPSVVTVCPPGSSEERIVVSVDATAEALVAACRRLPPADVYLTHSSEVASAAEAEFGGERVYEMLHMPVDDPVRVAASRWNLVGVSASQLSDLWRLRPDVPFVWHGTDVRPVGPGDGGYLAWVGRFAPEKGPLDAIAAAEMVGAPLRLAGRATNRQEQDYFDECVAPRLSGSIEYVGEVTSAERDALMSSAAAALVPTMWREPFGLTAIESAMVGTPVLGYPSGATSELLSTGIGDVCRGVEELAGRAAATIQAGAGRRQEVAAAARKHFSLEAHAARLTGLLGGPARQALPVSG